MDIMDSCRRTDRASDAAREALLEAKTKGRAKSSLAKVCSWMERDGSNWYDSIGDPSAGDFVGVLRALDGEIAVEVTTGNDIFVIWRISSHSFGMVDTPSSDKDNHHDDLMRADVEGYIRRSDSVRLLHRTDTQELPGAVQEAMEGEQG